VHRTTVRRTALRRVATAGWAGLILAGSLLPASAIAPAMPGFSGADLLAHAAAYAALCVLAVWAWPGRRRLVVAGVVLLLGILVEVLQPLTARSLSALDMLADAAGVVAGLATAWAVRKLGRTP